MTTCVIIDNPRNSTGEWPDTCLPWPTSTMNYGISQEHEIGWMPCHDDLIMMMGRETMKKWWLCQRRSLYEPRHSQNWTKRCDSSRGKHKSWWKNGRRVSPSIKR